MKEITSRQLKWQRKMMEEGRCIICGKPAIPEGKYCVRCWLNQYTKNRGLVKKKASNSKNIKMLQLLVNEDWERRNKAEKDYTPPSPFTVYGPIEVEKLIEGNNVETV